MDTELIRPPSADVQLLKNALFAHTHTHCTMVGFEFEGVTFSKYFLMKRQFERIVKTNEQSPLAEIAAIFGRQICRKSKIKTKVM